VKGRLEMPWELDTSKPDAARMYDYMIGGKDNYASDRQAVKEIMEINPDVPLAARLNRAFLGRAVRYLAREAGIRQFLDIGTGIPAAGSVHEIAQSIAPESRVVYVDNDVTVLAHARALLTSHGSGVTEYIQADLRDTGAILTEAAKMLDFSEPVAVLLIAILHFIPDDDDPQAIVRRLMAAVPAGSYLAISHAAPESFADAVGMSRLNTIYAQTPSGGIDFRSSTEVGRFFDGLELADPGVVKVTEWHPEPGAPDSEKTLAYAAVGRKP
jgi:hypothetical protein